MCTQVIDLLLQGFEKEWNTASPKRSFFKFKNLRVLVSFLIFFLWTACSSCKVFYRCDEVWCVFFWNSLRWNNTVTADETWLASFDTKPFIYLPTLSIAGFSHHRDHYVTVPYFTNSKAAAFTSHKNQDLLICGMSKQLAWLSHFTVVAPKKRCRCVYMYMRKRAGPPAEFLVARSEILSSGSLSAPVKRASVSSYWTALAHLI